MSEEARQIMDAHEAAGGNRNGKMPESEKPTPVTESEKLADQMARDITSGKVEVKDRPVVRKALDEADGRTKAKDIDESVWRRATGRLANNWRRNPDGTAREVGWYEPGPGGAMKPLPHDVTVVEYYGKNVG